MNGYDREIVLLFLNHNIHSVVASWIESATRADEVYGRCDLFVK